MNIADLIDHQINYFYSKYRSHPTKLYLGVAEMKALLSYIAENVKKTSKSH